jgi:Zinc carboxypeptidase
MSFRRNVASCCLAVGLLLAHGAAHAQLPTPVSVLGHTPGDDFYLANYEDAVKYFHTLAASSDRMKMFTVGKSTEGRDIEVAVISSPENLAHLDDYKKAAAASRPPPISPTSHNPALNSEETT